MKPAAVVLLRLFNVYNSGTDRQWEEEVQNYDEISLTGLICMVDLFEIPRSTRIPSGLQPFLGTDPSFYPAGTSADISVPVIQYPTCAAAHKFPPDTLVLIDGYPITESLKRTISLFGAKFVEPHKIGVGGENQKQILFTLEGHFLLSRPSDIDSLIFFPHPTGCSSPTIMAECYGAPSLKESTVLTKSLGDHGVPVKVRTKPRSPRKNKN
ncbi:hypothetical protein B0H13DRAFT_2014061 [Mycena leptocephala]|nr:hypothetical protein B0H13DRAFT_2014061 [Mycena leptocephala]